MEKLNHILIKSMAALATVSGILIFVSVFIQVLNTVFRKWFGFAILWSDEFCQYAAIEACFLATPYLVMQSKELSVGVINSVIKNKHVLMAIRLVFVVFELVLFFLFSRYCLTAASALKATNVMLNSIDMPKYILYYIAEATFILDFVMLASAPILNKGGFYHD